MSSWVRYCVAVYAGLLLAGAIVVPHPESTIGSAPPWRPPMVHVPPPPPNPEPAHAPTPPEPVELETAATPPAPAPEPPATCRCQDAPRP